MLTMNKCARTPAGRRGQQRRGIFVPYRPPRLMSRPVAQNLTAVALGALLVYLLGRNLPPVEQRFGWDLARRWLGELVEAQHARGAA